jgi:cytochrome c1
MRDPKELRDDQWRGVIAHMRVRGNLTGQEARDVLAFLQGSN